jgi:hypothetical protein
MPFRFNDCHPGSRLIKYSLRPRCFTTTVITPGAGVLHFMLNGTGRQPISFRAPNFDGKMWTPYRGTVEKAARIQVLMAIRG